MLSTVDLPQPECPMIETNSPFAIFRSTSRRTSVVGRARVKLMPTWRVEIGPESPPSRSAWCRG